MLLDSITELVQLMPDEVTEDRVINVLLPPIVEKWSQLPVANSALPAVAGMIHSCAHL